MILKIYPKFPGIPCAEIVRLEMSANDCLYHTPNQPSYLINYMYHEYDISIYIMFVNRLNATNSVKLSLEMRKG